MNLTTLSEFRTGLYRCFNRSCDALMNVNDALLTGSCRDSFVQLSQSPYFERQWPSLYEAFEDAIIDQEALMKVFTSSMPLPASDEQAIMILDASKVERPESPTARDRTYVHVDNLPECRAPVTPGWMFSTVVLAPSTPGSWTFVLDNRRIPSDKTPANVAAEQLKKIVPMVNQRLTNEHRDHLRQPLRQVEPLQDGQAALMEGAPTEGAPTEGAPTEGAPTEGAPKRPILTADGSYGTATFLEQTKDIECDKLLRIKKNRKLYRAAPPPDPHKRGPHYKDGSVFKCGNPSTYGVADGTWTGTDGKGHPVEVTCWENLHFKECRDIPVCVTRVVRQGAKQTKRDPQTSWLIWEGKSAPCLSRLEGIYKCRFSIEHGYRFEKQDLHWCEPHFRTPEQFEVWTHLMSAVHDQLVLARGLVEAQRLPWESRSRELTPAQVRRGMPQILKVLGTPARPCKPRGLCAPGRKEGAVVKKAKRYPVIKKIVKKVSQKDTRAKRMARTTKTQAKTEEEKMAA